eukprot:TRINITY_DN1024_c3_g1_i1.p1 TRINITY_DN1024_c3_g1~~TRINITY_DN1024_c3_g1_i1.p1  ORF type:complete len:339 (+),score=145.09 TRINITY_DN1024_c3_g1_i1:143-1018(+)
MVTLVTLTGKKPATVSINDVPVCTVTPKSPNAHLKQRMPYDTPTRVTVSGSTVDVCGYTAKFDIDEALAKMEERRASRKRKKASAAGEAVARATAAAAAPSPTPAASKSPKKSPKGAPKAPTPKTTPKAAPAAKAAPSEAVELSMEEVMAEAGMSMEDYAVDVGQVMIDGKDYFIDYRDYRVYSGSTEDPEQVGFYHPKTKTIEQTRPDHTLEDSEVFTAALASEKQRVMQLRKQWEAEHPEADSDGEATIDSDDDENFEGADAFRKKRRVEESKLETVMRGNKTLSRKKK